MRKKTAIILAIIVLIINTILYIILQKSDSTDKQYDIESNLYSVVKVKDDFFDKNKRKEYKDYDLILVSYTLNNLNSENYKLDYELKTSNNNTYSRTSGNYITNSDFSFVEDFYKICNSYFNNNGEVLTGQKKRFISAFMIPKNEFKEENTFSLISFSNANIEPLVFNISQIQDSSNMKELFLEEELEEIEQRISLYYTAYHLINTINSQTIAWNSENLKSLDLYLQTTIALLEADHPFSWNSQTTDNDFGYNLDYEKCNQLFSEISQEISMLQSSSKIQKDVQNTLEKYNNLYKINYSEYTNNSYTLRSSCLNIKEFLTE